MLRLDVNRLLMMRGVKSRTKWLTDRGLTYKQAVRLVHADVRSISFDLLMKLCAAFECAPNELFVYVPKGMTPAPYMKPLLRTMVVQSPQEILANLPQEEVERLLKEMQELRRGKG